jgi:hypothetical protein
MKHFPPQSERVAHFRQVDQHEAGVGQVGAADDFVNARRGAGPGWRLRHRSHWQRNERYVAAYDLRSLGTTSWSEPAVARQFTESKSDLRCTALVLVGAAVRGSAR